MKRIAAAAILFSVALPGGLSAQTGEPPEVTRAYDVVYANPGGAELRLDIDQPSARRGPLPAVLVIHGGAWKEGGKEENRKLLVELARRGYVAVSPQYRLCPADAFPAQVHDVKAAVRWVRANAASLGVDPERIGAMGFSAGGHLALMLGVTGPQDGLEGDPGPSAPSSAVRAVVSYFAPVDLADPSFSEFGRSLVSNCLGKEGPRRKDLAKRTSPLTFVSAGDAPVLAFQGTKDPLVPYRQALRLAEALTVAGVPGRVELLVGAGHGWQGEEHDRTMKETFEFFDRHLKAPAAAPPVR
jgi:acetyl esterase/lipase